ncbi:MAG: F0F1 ATP synthase subunit A, partial [Acidimicrobiales bacterium]
MNVLALKFPEISELLVWKDLFPGFNKIAIISLLAMIIPIVVFMIAASKPSQGAPKGVRNFAESVVEFIQNGVVMQTMGRDGMGWTPFLLSLFCFIYLLNVPGIIPLFQMPATARMAAPMVLALLIWVVFNAVGFKHQGIGYLKSVLFPPGVPKLLYFLVTPIELISTFLVRPFSLAVRLFANMMAGHILLVTFAVL